LAGFREGADWLVFGVRLCRFQRIYRWFNFHTRSLLPQNEKIFEDFTTIHLERRGPGFEDLRFFLKISLLLTRQI